MIMGSGIAQRYTLTTTEGEKIDVQTTIPDVVRWERNHDGKAFITVDGVPSVTAMMEVAYYACRRQHITEIKTFDQWFPTIEDFDLHKDDDDDLGDDEYGGLLPRPTKPDQLDD